MSGKIFIILLVLYVCATISSQLIPDFDTLTLAQLWKRSSCCSVNKLESPLADCNQCMLTDLPSDWTIHGLWPTDSTPRRNKVEFCDNPIKHISFQKYSANLLANMNKYWPNNNHQRGNEAFWQYQWDKHGTCAIEILAKKNDESYFSTTVHLYNRNQVGNMLQNEGILPKHSYTIDRIYAALQKNMQNYKPIVRCIKKGGISYVSEVYMCFTKQFNLKHCNSNSNCDRNVYYP